MDARRGQAARSQLRQLHRVCPLARKCSYPSSSCSAPRGLDISCKINIPHKHEDHCQGFPKETTLGRAGRTSCCFESLWRVSDPKVGFSNQPRSAEELLGLHLNAPALQEVCKQQRHLLAKCSPLQPATLWRSLGRSPILNPIQPLRRLEDKHRCLPSTLSRW